MNKPNQLISLILAAGVAVFSLANAPFLAGLRGDVLLGVGASVAIFGVAVHDYSRRARSLTSPVRLLRPALHAECAGDRPASSPDRLAA